MQACFSRFGERRLAGAGVGIQRSGRASNNSSLHITSCRQYEVGTASHGLQSHPKSCLGQNRRATTLLFGGFRWRCSKTIKRCISHHRRRLTTTTQGLFVSQFILHSQKEGIRQHHGIPRSRRRDQATVPALFVRRCRQEGTNGGRRVEFTRS